MLTILCPSCGHAGTAPDDYAGRTVQCPRCRKMHPAIAEPPPLDTHANLLHNGMRWATYALLGIVCATEMTGCVYSLQGIADSRLISSDEKFSFSARAFILWTIGLLSTIYLFALLMVFLDTCQHVRRNLRG